MVFYDKRVRITRMVETGRGQFSEEAIYDGMARVSDDPGIRAPADAIDFDSLGYCMIALPEYVDMGYWSAQGYKGTIWWNETSKQDITVERVLRADGNAMLAEYDSDVYYDSQWIKTEDDIILTDSEGNIISS